MSQTNLNLDSSVKNVDLFEFEPIKGYPMLSWKGKRPFRSTHYYPAQHKETHGDEVNGWLNQIFWGDNLQVMSHLLKKLRGQIKLIYIDPPYDSKADYKKTIKTKGKSVGNSYTTFEEKQYSDIWSNDEYLQFMYERIILLRELLSDSGTIYLQCDTHRGHYLKCIMDEIFGTENEINTISWQRSHAHGDTGQGAKHFGRATDYILVYSKTQDFTFNPQYIPYTEEVIKRDYKYTDEKTGEKYRLTPVDGPGGAAKGNPFYEFLGVSGYYRYSKSKMQELYDKGEIVKSSTGKSLHRKKFLKDAKGTPVMDIWSDASRISPTSSERLDYPTQKPKVLLERIINTSSNPGDIVFDCFMGSGTTQDVALRLGRRFIGADINLGAIQTTTKRLIKSGTLVKTLFEKKSNEIYNGFSVYNVNHYDIFRNPTQAKELLIEALEIQALPTGSVYDGEKDGFMVKIMPVNRIATKADLRELVMNIDQKEWMRRRDELGPNKPVENILLVCMGHDPDLAAELQHELSDFKLKVEVVDILRDRADLEFKRDAEAKITRKGDKLTIEKFYPLNLLQKLSLQKEKAGDWRELVESIMIDFNYDGAVLQPAVVDIPTTVAELVRGQYFIPANAGTIRVKITDLLSESLEITLPAHG